MTKARRSQEKIAAGVNVPKPKTEILTGVSVCLLQDPDGNCVELKEGRKQE